MRGDFSRGLFQLEGWRYPPKTVINLSRTYESYTVKENHIGAVIREVLRYRDTHTQTDKKTSCYFSIRIIIRITFNLNFFFR